jgi:hypothetical protein
MAPTFRKGFTFNSSFLAHNPVRAVLSAVGEYYYSRYAALFRLLHPQSAVSTNMLPACAFGKTRPKEQ